jgi:hypothetical protein
VNPPRDSDAAECWTGPPLRFQAGRVPITPDCGIAGRCDEPVPDKPTCAQRAHSVSGRRSPPLRLDPPSKAPGLTLSGLKYYHDPHAISQPDKPPINIRLIHHFLQHRMWIITDFSLCTGMTRAPPGKRPLLVPARLRNPQHFHRLCTGLASLRTSHPHVCAQAAGGAVLSSAGAPRARSRDTLVPSPAPCQVGTDVRRCRAHVVPQVEAKSRGQAVPSSAPA